MNENDNEIIEVESQIKCLKSKIKAFDRYTKGVAVKIKIQYERQLKEAEKRLEELKIKKDIDLVKDYLKSKGVDLDSLNSVAFSMASYNNYRYLLINAKSTYVFDSHNSTTKYSAYKLVFDTDGNILLDLTEDTNAIIGLKDGIKSYQKISPDNIFLNDETIIIGHLNTDRLYESTIYKLNDNKFTPHRTYNNYQYEVCEVASGEKFVYINGSLYSVNKDEDIFKIECHSMSDPKTTWINIYNDSEHSEEIRNQFNDTISNILIKDNLLCASDGIYVEYEDYKINTEAFAYVDTKGRIVSKMYFTTNKGCESIEIINNSFEETIGKVKDILIKNAKKYVACEKARKAKEEKRKTNIENQMIKTISCSYSDGTSRVRTEK